MGTNIPSYKLNKNNFYNLSQTADENYIPGFQPKAVSVGYK